MSEQCDGCRFWRLKEPLEGEYKIVKGECKRYAPYSRVPPNWVIPHPITLPDDWCGEFEAIRKAEEKS